MRPLEIVVCMKPVPDPRRWDRLKLDPTTMLLRRGDIPAIVNPLDRNAIEQALVVRGHAGGRVSVVSMAPPEAEEQLLEAVAMGCDAGYLVADPALAGADSLATARCLAAAIRRIGADLVFCGAYSLDGSTSQVGPQVAELLGVPDLTRAVSLEVEGETVRARCRVESGEVTCECEPPALVTFDKEVNAPRLASMRGILRAASAGITRWAAADIGLAPGEVGLAGSPTQMRNVFAPSTARKGEMLEGSPNEAASALLGRLRAARLLG